MRRGWLLLALVVLLLAACGDDDKDGGGSQLGLFDWSRAPDSIVVRLDNRPLEDSPASLLNSIPPCTLWGDGRVVWTTVGEYGAEDILEARVADDAVIRAFLEDIIGRGFYEWEDELILSSEVSPVIESITVSLYNETRTVRRYSSWPQNSYSHILERCERLSSTPVRVLPAAGWVSAYEIPRDSAAPSWLWPPDAPFTLRELAASQEERWLEHQLATDIWLSARERQGNMQVVERGGAAYQVAIVVPGYSRDAAAAPAEATNPSS
ncbi:MAG: hypothetical protein OZ934_00285 [Anaerolineae bacterium]|nr:hypothetical protein [Anaerolineae bacterium]